MLGILESLNQIVYISTVTYQNIFRHIRCLRPATLSPTPIQGFKIEKMFVSFMKSIKMKTKTKILRTQSYSEDHIMDHVLNESHDKK